MFLDAAVGILLLCGFLHVSGIFVDREVIELTVELDKCAGSEEEEGEEGRFAARQGSRSRPS
jgi:hypothetical protein